MTSVPPRDLARVAWRRVLREVRKRTAPRKPRAISVGVSVLDLARRLRERQTPRFFGLFPEQAALIARFFPEAAEMTLVQADKICEHRFDILGSGEYTLGDPIDWHTDFIHGKTWPLEHHARLKLTSPTGGWDVKVPWELSRFHHALRLGQAYQYTEDETYAAEIVSQISHWLEANPYEFGVNWAGPMDVAIRVINWIWAYYLIIESKALNTKFLASWLTSLQQHGEYLLKNLEDGWPRTNHLIANLAGLAYLGILFPEFPDAARWRSVALGRLWPELERQVHADGMDYEASTSYHRLVTEIALHATALCIVNNIEVPQTTQVRLGMMLDVIMAYTQPDGLAPVIGDADDGRLLPLSAYADSLRGVNDHRHLLALGSIVLEREMRDWAGFVDPGQRLWSVMAGDEWQDAFWCFASDSAARYTDVLLYTTERPEGIGLDDWVRLRPGVRVRARALPRRVARPMELVGSRGFEAGGLYVMRSGNCQMVIDAGGIGQDGAGGHAHNDVFSMMLTAYGHTFLIDPGAYTYTANPEERNRFRSTASHNTLQVRDEEINCIPLELFRLENDAQIVLHHWIAAPSYDLFDASHNGYARMKPGILHRRQIWLDKKADLWILHDNIRLADPLAEPDSGQPAEEPEKPGIDITLWFHFTPVNLTLDSETNAIQATTGTGPNLTILPLGNFPLTAQMDEGWYAPRYGIKQKAPVAKYSGCVKLPADMVLLLYPHPEQPGLREVRAAGRSALRTMQQMLSPALRRRAAESN